MLTFDGPCPFLTCLETGPHTHDVCPECNAVRHGNMYCKTCRKHHGIVIPGADDQPTGKAGPTAYLLLAVDTANPTKIIGADRFSDDSPTLPNQIRTLVALTGHGADFSEGLADLERQLSHPHNEWLRAIIQETGGTR